MAFPSLVLRWVPYSFYSARFRRVMSPERRPTTHSRGSARSSPYGCCASPELSCFFTFSSRDGLLKGNQSDPLKPKDREAVDPAILPAAGEVKGVVRTVDRKGSTRRCFVGCPDSATCTRPGSFVRAWWRFVLRRASCQCACPASSTTAPVLRSLREMLLMKVGSFGAAAARRERPLRLPVRSLPLLSDL